MNSVVAIVFVIFIVVVLIKLIRIVRQSEEAVVETFGKYSRNLKSGINFLIPFMEKVVFTADLREQFHTFEPQSVITSDNATVYLNAVTYYRITDPKQAYYGVANYQQAIEQMIITTLRNVIGELELDQTLTSRNVINAKLQSTLDEVTHTWGIKITRVEVKEITPSADIAEAMSTQMVAERNRRASILEAEGAKQAAILKSEGEKMSRILQAQGMKEAAIIEAQGQAEAALLRAQGEKQALKELLSAFSATTAEERVLALKYLEMLPKLADGKGVSLVLPDRLSELASLTTLAGQALKQP